ncbi:hypothetical protein [Parasitella parasitica]|uniref:Uncharacterized protein n=1 Tax=Parasitella parasitica TaxID=35722 RepID=A0A0B7N4M1_9FUNG|nr:hypothetical protein [Parasitella parasitica]
MPPHPAAQKRNGLICRNENKVDQVAIKPDKQLEWNYDSIRVDCPTSCYFYGHDQNMVKGDSTTFFTSRAGVKTDTDKQLKTRMAQKSVAGRLSKAHEKNQGSLNPHLYAHVKEICVSCNALYLQQVSRPVAPVHSQQADPRSTRNFFKAYSRSTIFQANN